MMKYECAPWVDLPGWVCDEDGKLSVSLRFTHESDLGAKGHGRPDRVYRRCSTFIQKRLEQ